MLRSAAVPVREVMLLASMISETSTSSALRTEATRVVSLRMKVSFFCQVMPEEA